MYLPSADAGGLLPWRQHDLVGCGQRGQAVTRIVRVRALKTARRFAAPSWPAGTVVVIEPEHPKAVVSGWPCVS